jgi:hypothetical protein
MRDSSTSEHSPTERRAFEWVGDGWIVERRGRNGG